MVTSQARSYRSIDWFRYYLSAIVPHWMKPKDIISVNVYGCQRAPTWRPTKADDFGNRLVVQPSQFIPTGSIPIERTSINIEQYPNLSLIIPERISCILQHNTPISTSMGRRLHVRDRMR